MNKEELTKGIANYDKELAEQLEKKDKLFANNPDCQPIFIAIVGSYSYGLDVPTSDLDLKGVYIQDLDSILKDSRLGDSTTKVYKSQLGGGKKKGSVESNEEKDLSFYEIGRYLDLLSTNNANILELLNTPENCIIYKHPIWDLLVEELNKTEVLSKICFHSFHSYAKNQIAKATGLNKNINNPMPEEKKTPLDYCYFLSEGKSYPLSEYLEKNGFEQKFCGLVNTPNSRDIFGLYYDNISHNIFSENVKWITREQNKNRRKSEELSLGYGFKGILKESENENFISNEMRLSSVPKMEDVPGGDISFLGFVSYNKDGYAKFCKDYSKYWRWVENRNEDRYNDNTSHDQDYDGKNMSHCLRLLYMAREIAEGKGVVVRRNEEHRLELLSIKKGFSTYEEIIEKNNIIIDGLEELYKNSDLPDKADVEAIDNILLKVRQYKYGLHL